MRGVVTFSLSLRERAGVRGNRSWRIIAARQVFPPYSISIPWANQPAVLFGARFPLTLTLSFGEREQPADNGILHRQV